MNKIDRYFYIPEECVKDITEKAESIRQAHRERVSQFLDKAGTELSSEYGSGRICDLAFEIDQSLPKGWRKRDIDWYKGRKIQRAVPDLRSKEGKALKKELEEINKNAVSPYEAINAVAQKYGLRKEMVIQDCHWRSFGGSYCPHVKAYLLQVPATGDGALSPDYIVPPEITEITESQFIAITKENGTLRQEAH